MSTITAGNVTVSCSLSADTTGNLVFQSGGNVTAMTIDTSQNVGIGTSATTYNYQTKNVAFYDATSAGISIVGGSKILTLTAQNAGGIYVGSRSNDPLILATNDTERARIDSSGNLLVGRTDTAFTSGQAGMCVLPTQGITFTKTNSPNLGACMYLHRTFGAGTGNLIEFAYDTVTRGNISTNGSTVAYNTSSDYRLKENVQPMTGALAKVAALKPCTYTWKSTGEAGEGFIAHELAEVVPDAVTGEKDAVNEDGSIKPQGIDTSFLVATLTAAIQEQQQMIETLQAEVAALKGVKA